MGGNPHPHYHILKCGASCKMLRVWVYADGDWMVRDHGTKQTI